MLNRDAGILVDASVEATSWLAHFWAALAGAALGSISGPVTACALSAVLDSDVGACVPAGVGVGALAGALIGLVAAPLCQHGSRRRQPAAQRPAGATWAAAGLVVTAVVAAVWVWLTEWAATQGGLASLSALLAAARGGLEPRVAGQVAVNQRLRELVPPTVFLLVSVAVVGLVLLPSTARDFWSSQPPLPLRDIDRGPEGSPP